MAISSGCWAAGHLTRSTLAYKHFSRIWYHSLSPWWLRVPSDRISLSSIKLLPSSSAKFFDVLMFLFVWAFHFIHLLPAIWTDSSLPHSFNVLAPNQTNPMMSTACIVKITLLLLINYHQTLGGFHYLAPFLVCVPFSDHELCDVHVCLAGLGRISLQKREKLCRTSIFSSKTNCLHSTRSRLNNDTQTSIRFFQFDCSQCSCCIHPVSGEMILLLFTLMITRVSAFSFLLYW